MPWNNDDGWGGLNKRRLSWQQPIAVNRRERFVNSWNELLVALSDYAASVTQTPSGTTQTAGGVIKFACPFVWQALVTIPSACQGLVIDGGGFNILAKSAGLAMFSCAVSGVQFRNIRAYQTSDAGLIPWGNVFTIGACDEVRIVDCYAGTQAALVVADGMRNGWINDNRILTFNGAGASITMVTSTRNSIRHNVFASTSSNAIVLGSACSRNAVSDNKMSGNGIITTASSGLNTIVGNANPGTITYHVNDAVGVNS